MRRAGPLNGLQREVDLVVGDLVAGAGLDRVVVHLERVLDRGLLVERLLDLDLDLDLGLVEVAGAGLEVVAVEGLLDLDRVVGVADLVVVERVDGDVVIVERVDDVVVRLERVLDVDVDVGVRRVVDRVVLVEGVLDLDLDLENSKMGI